MVVFGLGLPTEGLRFGIQACLPKKERLLGGTLGFL